MPTSGSAAARVCSGLFHLACPELNAITTRRALISPSPPSPRRKGISAPPAVTPPKKLWGLQGNVTSVPSCQKWSPGRGHKGLKSRLACSRQPGRRLPAPLGPFDCFLTESQAPLLLFNSSGAGRWWNTREDQRKRKGAPRKAHQASLGGQHLLIQERKILRFRQCLKMDILRLPGLVGGK